MLNDKIRPIYIIAKEIFSDWDNVSPYAEPYLLAMRSLNTIEDDYYLDNGESIILYFLSNAASWHGETARRIKKELRGMVT